MVLISELFDNFGAFLSIKFDFNYFYVFSLQKLYSDFELQGIEEEKLNSKTYQTITNRLQLEEATASVCDGGSREKDDVE